MKARNFRWWQQGAFAGGIAEYLIRDCCISYELFVGVQPAVY
jgi:hypothetical protein